MGGFLPALPLADVPPGTCREVRVGDKAVAVYNVAGTVYATTNTCPHRGGPLGQGFLDGRTVMCPWHAWTWDVATGENTANPAMTIARYDAKVEGGQVLVRVD